MEVENTSYKNINIFDTIDNNNLIHYHTKSKEKKKLYISFITNKFHKQIHSPMYIGDYSNMFSAISDIQSMYMELKFNFISSKW
jgi:hypothetical protein